VNALRLRRGIPKILHRCQVVHYQYVGRIIIGENTHIMCLQYGTHKFVVFDLYSIGLPGNHKQTRGILYRVDGFTEFLRGTDEVERNGVNSLAATCTESRLRKSDRTHRRSSDRTWKARRHTCISGDCAYDLSRWPKEDRCRSESTLGKSQG
jgi:hypothetical protein